jgi:hypothetical protein
MSRIVVETSRQTLESTRYVSVYKAVDKPCVRCGQAVEGIVEREERERLRREIAPLLADALSHLKLEPKAAALVAEFIDNYEFGLAYEIMVEQLEGKAVPADAVAILKAVAIRMGREISN